MPKGSGHAHLTCPKGNYASKDNKHVCYLHFKGGEVANKQEGNLREHLWHSVLNRNDGHTGHQGKQLRAANSAEINRKRQKNDQESCG